MAGVRNLTQVEAAERARLLEVAGYDITLDLTDGSGNPGETTFRSLTEVTFSCTEPGAETFIEVAATPKRTAVGLTHERDAALYRPRSRDGLGTSIPRRTATSWSGTWALKPNVLRAPLRAAASTTTVPAVSAAITDMVIAVLGAASSSRARGATHPYTTAAVTSARAIMLTYSPRLCAPR